MNFYNKLTPEQQEQAAEHMQDLLKAYLPPGTTQARISQALEELNPYVQQRAIGFTHADQGKVLNWLREQ